jgi:multidrug resistance efflux pump
MISIVFKQVRSAFTSVWSFLKGVGTKRPWVSVLVVGACLFILGYALFGVEPTIQEQAPADERSIVTLISVADFTEGNQTQIGVGSETIVRSETSGKIVQVVPRGARVAAGTTIALFENAAQQASLLQAEGALEAAKATREKTESGLRSEQIALLETNVESAENNTVATLLSVYATVDNAIRNVADQLFSNPESNAPQLNLTTSNAQRKTQIQNDRVALGSLLNRQAERARTLSVDTDLERELNTVDAEVREVRAFMDAIIAALNEAIPTGNTTANDIASFKTSTTNTRTSVNSALSSIASTRGALEVARKNLEEGLAGAEDTDLSAAAASVKQVQGAYDAALAAYQKTIVRAPVSGTIDSCNATIGDVLTVGADICRIRTAQVPSGTTFTLPLTSVKYTPTGAFVFTVNAANSIEALPVETSIVTAEGITVSGLFGDEFIVRDVRGLKSGDAVDVQ